MEAMEFRGLSFGHGEGEVDRAVALCGRRGLARRLARSGPGVACPCPRNNNEAIYQVNPNHVGAPGAGLGTAAGDAAATSGLTSGAIDAEPFYSPDGDQVFFSSDRLKGHWAIYDIAQSPPLAPSAPADDAIELSQVRGHGMDN